MTAITRGRWLPRLGRLPRPGARTIVALAVVVAILVGVFFWLRQSSLAAVQRVTITGVSGPDAVQIREALTGAARGMSTLDLDRGRLRATVASYPVVRALRLHAEFPHTLRISVAEQVPVAVVAAGGERTVVAGNGTLLHDVHPRAVLPTIASSVVPGGDVVTGTPRAAVALLAAAPYPLIGRIASASVNPQRGLEAVLRSGPTLVFGSGAELAAKWNAAVAVLASSSSAGAGYIDVTDPARPAAGAENDGISGLNPDTLTSTTG